MSTHVFGIRHHGPGSARALVRALNELRPDIILVEGPPEADDLVSLAAHEDMKPPVALLAYTGDSSSASFWPFAVFSPEWQAIQYAVKHDVPLRFCDLPAASKSAVAPQAAAQDPIAGLASAAGYDDPERWWEDMIEHRRDGTPAFEAVAEAMTEVRESHGAAREDLVREAHMRQILRAAIRQGRERIAVVCGAWHVPALTGQLPPSTHDAALLKGLPKAAVSMTWVPWTHGRLAWWTGYGAGVRAPGWYHHLFTVDDRPIERWLVAVAQVLREDDIPVSSAHVIEATRLAETLAVLRGRPHPGLSELTEATRAVLCEGDEVRLELVQRKVVVGEQLGEVPSETPAVPLARDVAATQRRLRLPPQALARDLDLDLRKATDLERSRLLHRLRLLGVQWGTSRDQRSGKGTFWESWQLSWRPEFAVDLIVAGAYGTTLQGAVSAKVVELSKEGDLPALTGLVEACLLADLPGAQVEVLRALHERAVLDSDVTHLMAAIPPLARTLRYGDVRATSAADLAPVLISLLKRVQLGLPGAVAGIDETAAKEFVDLLDPVHESVRLSDGLPLRGEWLDTLRSLADRPDLPGLLGGRLLRILRDEAGLTFDEVQVRLARVLTVGVRASVAASFVEGFLGSGGLLLVHDGALLALVDRWLSGLTPENFATALPLLRRTFAEFAGPQRRAIGERVRHLGSAKPSQSTVEQLDFDRVATVVPTLELLVGSRR